QVISQFNGVPIFICDISKREKLEYELRFIFDDFENIDKNSFIKKERKIQTINDSKHLVTKKHKKIIDLDNDELIIFFDEFKNKLYGHS
ncbi:hypothetical protein OFM39_30275, partial [Escherichia coli]|nr:hypothetical protein [Escherichia coli]